MAVICYRRMASASDASQPRRLCTAKQSTEAPRCDDTVAIGRDYGARHSQRPDLRPEPVGIAFNQVGKRLLM